MAAWASLSSNPLAAASATAIPTRTSVRTRPPWVRAASQDLLLGGQDPGGGVTGSSRGPRRRFAVGRGAAAGARATGSGQPSRTDSARASLDDLVHRLVEVEPRRSRRRGPGARPRRAGARPARSPARPRQRGQRQQRPPGIQAGQLAAVLVPAVGSRGVGERTCRSMSSTSSGTAEDLVGLASPGGALVGFAGGACLAARVSRVACWARAIASTAVGGRPWRSWKSAARLAAA